MSTFKSFSILKIVASFLTMYSVQAQNITIPELDLSFNAAEIELSAEAEKYIQSVVDIMRKEAIYREKINFDHIQQVIRYYAHGAQKIGDTHGAVEKAIPLLKDHHSYFMSSTYVTKSLGFRQEEIETIKKGNVPHIEKHKIDSLKKALNYGSGKIINGKIGYLSVPAFGNLYYEPMTMFADSLQRLIKRLDQRELAGWIIDLRNNGGGADMPMITGLGPLLDSSNVYYTIDEEGKEQGRSYYKNGGYYNVDKGEKAVPPIIQSTINYQVTNNDLPVALLTSFKTASSAEAVTAIFAGQPNVKIIGDKTNGLTSVNKFIFLEDNSVLNLTVGYYANRNNQLYRQGIDPDIPVNSENRDENDVVLEKAMEWIMK